MRVDYDMAETDVEKCKTYHEELKVVLKHTHGQKAPSNKTPALTKSTNMDIWIVDTSNQLFIIGCFASFKIKPLRKSVFLW